MSSPCGSAGSGSGMTTETRSPAVILRLVSSTGLPSIDTAPCLISICTRLRDMSAPRRAASHWSRRWPAASAPASSTVGAASMNCQPLSIQGSLRYERSSKKVPECLPWPGPTDDEDQEKPLDPEVEKVRRKLVRFMAINLGLLLLALMVVIAAIVYKSRKAPPANPPLAGDIQVPAGEPLAGDIVLPVGAKVISQSLSGNRISIDAELADGSRAIFVYDIAERRIIGRFAIRNK